MLDAPIDWSDLEHAGRDTRQLLRELEADPTRLQGLLTSVTVDESLLAASEEGDSASFVAFAVSGGGDRLGLEVIAAGDRQRAHAHPYCYSTVILDGGYQHTWLHEDEVGTTPYLTRFEQPGSCYTMHHSLVHRTEARADTLALTIRGPARESGAPGSIAVVRYEEILARARTQLATIDHEAEGR